MIAAPLRGVMLTGALLASTLSGCGGGVSDRPARHTEAQAPRLADTLALVAPGGVEVWFTDSRSARDSAGKSCVERVMQIRRAGQKIAVPLLYTGSTPRVINDSTIEAPIWLNCRPGNVYQVNLHTGRPVRVK
jgi:hypothetical protein